jgi:hypothetical protein
MSRLSFDSAPPRRHAAAALAVAIALAAGVALIASSGGGGKRARPVHTVATTSSTPASDHFAHTPAGAAAAATAWCVTTGRAFFSGGWDSVVSALASADFRARAERLGGAAAALVQRRLAALHTPYVARLWPLGYRVQEYAPAAARVRVWELGLLAASASWHTMDFQSATVSMRWTDGDWKVTAQPPGPDLTPPGEGATAGQVASWVDAVNQLKEYDYVP